MARAKRYYLPGHVWHLAHRCHKKEFLLKFASDRRRWLQWLFEAKKRYGLCILNYMVTSNHINPHSSEWNFSGYNEIQKPRERYALIDYKRLMELFHFSTIDDLRRSHKKWVEEILKTKNHVRENKWSQSIAVGSKSFIEGIKAKLGIRAKGRQIGESGGSYHLREAQVPYNSDFTPKNNGLRAENAYLWRDNP